LGRGYGERRGRADRGDGCGHKARLDVGRPYPYHWNRSRPVSVCAAASSPRVMVVFAELLGTKTMSFGPRKGSGALPARIFPKLIGVSFRSPLCWSVRIIRALPFEAVGVSPSLKAKA